MKPNLNQYPSKPSSRYVLGIEGTAPSMQSEICPVVTTVTPRPYYWAFFVWCYYDYYNHEMQLQSEFKKVDEYIRKNNYFIALGALLNNKRGLNNYIGADTIDHRTNLHDDTFTYDPEYLLSLSTMGNYNAGIFDGDASMNLILYENIDTHEKYTKPRITPSGMQLAKAFENGIKNSEYYQHYRLTNSCVPRDVLLELGKIMSVDLSSFPECKRLLKEYLFERERLKKLRESKDYLQYIYTDTGTKLSDRKNCRKILFDYYSPAASANALPDELRNICSEWETVVGRQYFVIGLQILWKHMTEMLVEPHTLDTWISYCMKNQNYSFDISNRVDEILDQQVFDFDERENMISQERHGRCDGQAVDYGFRLLLSVYNRFHNRNDLSEKAKSLLDFGSNDNSISMNEFFSKVNEFKEKSVEEFIIYIMKKCVVQQHMDTAFLKMLRRVDGFYVEKIDQTYRRKAEFGFGFQGLRIENLTSVMTDLECF